MKIPQSLSQFDNTPTLFIVSGKQHAHLYLGLNGQMRHIAEVRVPEPTYHDREGLFISGGNGLTLRSGSVYERNDKEVLTSFTTELMRRVKDVCNVLHIDEIILFVPQHVSNYVTSRFPASLREKIRAIIPGNYTYEHPLVVLSRLENEKQPVSLHK